MANIHLFDDTFEVHDVNPGGKKFERVSRVECVGENYESQLALDVHSQLYPLVVGSKFYLTLARTLNLDGSMREPVFNQTEEKSLADEYEYVMYGRVFKVTTSGDRATVFASFGGLLMSLCTEPRYLNSFEMDMTVYLLMRKA